MRANVLASGPFTAKLTMEAHCTGRRVSPGPRDESSARTDGRTVIWLAPRWPAGPRREPTQRPDQRVRLRDVDPRSYISGVMRRIFVVLGATAVLSAPMSAQVGRLDSLPPRAFWALAMRAKGEDSVAAKSAEWRAWASAAPNAAAPRLALAMLSRFDARYADAFAWLDSANRVATTPIWRSAVARERVGALILRGEFSTVPALMESIRGDTVGLPAGELAELRYLQMAAGRTLKHTATLSDLDSISALATSANTSLQIRIGCVRAALDRPRMLEHANRAIALARAARLGWLAANCEQSVGAQYYGLGEMGSAIAWFVKAEETAEQSSCDPTLAAALQYHGAALRTLGYVFVARKQLTAAIRVAQRIDDRNVEAWSLLNVAGTARLIGDASTTASALRRAEVLFQLTGDVSGYENTMLEKSLVQMMLGDYQGAMKIAVRGRAYADSLNDFRMAVRSLYVQSDVNMRMNKMDDAAKGLDEAEAIVRKELGQAWLTQAQEYRGLLALRRGENASAIRTLTEVRDAYSKRQELSRYSVNGALSLAQLRVGDSVLAARTLIEANRDLDAVRDTMAEGGLRRLVMPPSIWGGTNGNIDEVLAAFVRSPTWLPTVFAVTERSRSRALLNGMIGAESTTDSVAANEARRRVRASAAVLTEVQRALKPTTALLVYAGGAANARTSLMVITKTSARGLTLAPLDSLDRDIVRWLALMESGESGLGAGRRVAAAVLSTAMRDLPPTIKRLVIVPQGALYRLPFQALPIGTGVLGDRAVVTISPSVSLALAYAAEPRSVPARVLALGAGDTEIVSDLPQSMDLNIERSDRGNPLAPLRAAADEARAAANWGRGSMALTGVDASEAALKREAHGTFTVLHAAAHALTSDQTLGANYLILRADANDDGYVSGGELAELTSRLAMVVLSGCRTTGDFGSRGDAIDGLVAPLLARGVRTVVASHWAVSDQWTKVLMERFYQNLARGQTTAEAMNDAQTSLRRRGVPARFWAAFSVIGDGALTFDTATATSSGH